MASQGHTVLYRQRHLLSHPLRKEVVTQHDSDWAANKPEGVDAKEGDVKPSLGTER